MKIKSVTFNNKRKTFDVKTASRTYAFPYVKAEPQPASDDSVTQAYVDKDLGNEGFTYGLQSGKKGTVHIEQVLDYNRDPNYLRDLMLYKLTLEAQKRIAESPFSKREIVRRLGTSATQLYRLLDQTNYKKSVDQLVSLLQLLECEIDLVVRKKSA
jgi:hypothetical protein